MAQHSLSRLIDYSNRQGVEAVLDFFLQPGQTWLEYRRYGVEGYFWWEEWLTKRARDRTYQRITLEGMQICINACQGEGKSTWAWTLLAGFYALRGLLLRLALLPLTATLYVLSRTLGVVLNPDVWLNNTWKAFAMSLVWSLPICLIINNHVDKILPDIAFAPLLSNANLKRVAEGFELNHGISIFTAAEIGSVILGAFCAIGMAYALFGAKKFAQTRNAIVMADPKDNDRVTPSTVTITAPKHRPKYVSDGDQTKSNNRLHAFNEASDNIRFAYYAERNKRPTIYGGVPLVKAILDGYDHVYAANGTRALKSQCAALEQAYRNAVSSDARVDCLTAEERTLYRIDSEGCGYEASGNHNLQKKVGVT